MSTTALHGLSGDELIEPAAIVAATGGRWRYVGVRGLGVGARDHVFAREGVDVLVTVSREPVENGDHYAYYVAAREESNPADTLLVIRPDSLDPDAVKQAVVGMTLLIATDGGD